VSTTTIRGKVVLDITCYAGTHGTPGARRNGCVCPLDPTRCTPREEHIRKLRRERNRRCTRNRNYPKGNLEYNRWGARRTTVPQELFDPVAVDRILSGDRPARVAVADRYAAIDQLDGPGVTARSIAERVGVSPRTVQRRRAERRREENGHVHTSTR